MFLSCGVVISQTSIDEILAPDDELSVSTLLIPTPNGGSTCFDRSDCGAVACETFVDEDPDDGDGNMLTAQSIAGVTARLSFPTPSSSPSTTASAQKFVVNLSRCNDSCAEASGGTDPTYGLRMLCNSVQKIIIAAAIPITSLDQTDKYTWTFTADGDCTSDGSTVEASLLLLQKGSGAGIRRACAEAIEWEVTY